MTEKNAQKIIEYFSDLDLERGNIVRDTEKGIFGVSDISITNKFFEKINLNETNRFIDLGSGDGRINILASVYCQSTGIEIDKPLIEESKKHSKKLFENKILEEKELERLKFIEGDYEEFDYSKVNIIFSFADHFFTEKFISKLKKDFKGILYVYQGVFLPEGVKKGRTVWIQNEEGRNPIPIISYEF